MSELTETETEEIEAKAEETTSGSRKSRGPKLSAAQWADIRLAYEMGEANVGTLAARYGISPSAVSQHFTKQEPKLIFGRIPREATEKASKAAEAEKHTFASKRLDRIEKSKEDGFNVTSAINVLNSRLIGQAARDGVTLSSLAAEFKALRNAALINAEIIEQRRFLLDMDSNIDANELPILPIRDYSANELDELQRAGEGLDFDEEEIDPGITEEDSSSS
jgi:DNA-binding transcriptional ArsR family regulator